MLASKDAIILTGDPGFEFFDLQQRLAGTPQWQAAGLKPAWGTHLTLARLKCPLTAAHQKNTTRHLAWMAEQIEPFTLRFMVAGLFVVESDQFRFHGRLSPSA